MKTTLIHLTLFYPVIRSSRPWVFYKKGVLKDFPKFTGKHFCRALFFNKITAQRPATLLKKRIRNRCFPMNFVKFLKTTFYRTPPATVSVL